MLLILLIILAFCILGITSIWSIWGAPSMPIIAALAAILGVTLTSLINIRINEKQEKIKYLQEQIKVYGIINFYLSQNTLSFDYMNDIEIIFQNKYLDPKFSNDPGISPKLQEEINNFYSFHNEYASKIKQNNIEILNTLKNNWNYIDIQDIENFNQFQLNCIRLEIENKKEQKIPYKVILSLKPCIFYDKNFSNYITKKFQAKQKELAALQNRN